MITFTVPEEIREFFLQNQKEAYNKSRIMKDSVPGFFGVLHTWGRQIQYHPHIHYVAQGGALNVKDHNCISSSKDFFLLIFQLSEMCREKFKAIMANKKKLHLIPNEVWVKGWNVNIVTVFY